jgi:hypothetical protein
MIFEMRMPLDSYTAADWPERRIRCFEAVYRTCRMQNAISSSLSLTRCRSLRSFTIEILVLAMTIVESDEIRLQTAPNRTVWKYQCEECEPITTEQAERLFRGDRAHFACLTYEARRKAESWDSEANRLANTRSKTKASTGIGGSYLFQRRDAINNDTRIGATRWRLWDLIE